MNSIDKKERIDKRKVNNLKSNIKKAENRVNYKIWKAMKELVTKDPEFFNRIDREIESLKTQEEIDEYIKTCYERTYEEAKKAHSNL